MHIKIICITKCDRDDCNIIWSNYIQVAFVQVTPKKDESSGGNVFQILQHVAQSVVFYITMHVPFFKNCDVSIKITSEYTNLGMSVMPALLLI
jgi:hypothetical protein